VGCYIWHSEEGPGRVAAPPSPLLAVPNVIVHPSTASVPTSYYSMWHYNYLCILNNNNNNNNNTAKKIIIIIISQTMFMVLSS